MTCCGYPRSSWFCPQCRKRLVPPSAVRGPELGTSEPRPWPTFWVDLSEDIEASNVTLDLTRPVELPFMPTVGMTFEGVFWVNEEDAFDNDLCKITHVYFSLVTGRFDCRVDSAGPWPKDSPFTFEDAASFVESGCLLDGESDPREWAKKAESRGDRIPGYRRDGEP